MYSNVLQCIANIRQYKAMFGNGSRLAPGCCTIQLGLNGNVDNTLAMCTANCTLYRTTSSNIPFARPPSPFDLTPQTIKPTEDVLRYNNRLCFASLALIIRYKLEVL